MTSKSSPPIDLVPLGVVHSMEGDRLEWMTRVEQAWSKKKLKLWGYRNRAERAPSRVKYRPGLALNWVAADSRPDRNLIEGGRHLYYAEVAVYWEPEGRRAGELDPRGLQTSNEWMDVEISESDLNKLLFDEEMRTSVVSIPADPHACEDGSCDFVARLAEWIFNQHPSDGRPKSQGCLRAKAISDGENLGCFTTKQFTAAYQRVYETGRRRPPVTGWPLRDPYKSRRPQSQ